MSARTSIARTAFAALVVVACAEAGPGSNAGGSDAAIVPLADGGGTTQPADASPIPVTPDAAPPVAVDAAPTGGSPDAASGPPDAAPVPDAAPPPDARPAPDAAPVCPRAPCDLVEQCGCSGDLVCDLDVSNLPNTACRGVNGAGGDETSTCTVLEDCSGGYVCIEAGDEAACKEYCETDADCPGPRGKCVITLAEGSTPIDGATVCSSNCDPTNVAAGGCPASWGCYPGILGDDEIIVDCAPAGSGSQGATCATNADCAPNHACINLTFGSQCLQMCDTAAPNCATGSCQGTSPPLSIGGTTYGICR